GGRSPLHALTEAQAAGLRAALARADGPLPVYVGMRHWHPHLSETLERMARDGRRRALGLILSAFRCEASWERYMADVAAAVPRRIGRPRWSLAYQSRTGSPRDPWLEPDVVETIRDLAKAGGRGVVLSPIGFVADHVEVLYDLGTEARAIAAQHGLAYHRAAAVNDHPEFVQMLAELVREAA